MDIRVGFFNNQLWLVPTGKEVEIALSDIVLEGYWQTLHDLAMAGF